MKLKNSLLSASLLLLSLFGSTLVSAAELGDSASNTDATELIKAAPDTSATERSNLASDASANDLFLAQVSQYQSHRLDGQTLVIKHALGELHIAALTHNAFEIRPLGHQLVRPDFPSFSKDPKLDSSGISTRIINTKTSISIATPDLEAKVNKANLQITFLYKNQLVLEEEQGFFATHTEQGFRFKLQPDEKLMGAGQRVLGMDRRGHRLPLYNRAHYGYGTESTQMNYSLPAVMSTNKYIVLYDNPAKGFIDLGKTEKDILKFEANGGRQSYIFIAGDSYPSLINHYVDVTGKQPMPPRWALGNHASRFGYRNQQEVIDTIKRFRALDVPVDSIILDLYWFGKDIQGHMGNLDWDKQAFPEPDRMIEQLTELNVRTTLITEPFILKDSKTWQSAVEHDILAKNLSGTAPRTYDFYFGHTGLIDVFHKPAVDWFSKVYDSLAKQGVSGVWGDLGEPEVHPADLMHRVTDLSFSDGYDGDKSGLLATADEVHNAYGHQWAKLVGKSLAEALPNQRPFILMRAGFAGSQRLGMIPWTGDVSRSWDGLKPQPELTMQMSLFGLAYTHSDLGGFAGGESFDAEMYTRWLQYGVFQPIYRPHAQDNIAPEPIFHDANTLQIVREFIKLRYRLMPYNYSLAYQNSQTGMPLMRPMFFEHGMESTNDQGRSMNWLELTDQYYWGDAFLVKLLTEPQLTSAKVIFPTGQWTNYFTGEAFVVEKPYAEIDLPVSIDTLPVFVRGGSIITTVDDYDSEPNYSTQKLNIDIFYDPSVTLKKASVFNDDGISQDSINSGAFELINMIGVAAQRGQQALYSLDLSRELPNPDLADFAPLSRDLSIHIHHLASRPSTIEFNGLPLALLATEREFELERIGAFYHHQTQSLRVKVAWDHSSVSLTIR